MLSLVLVLNSVIYIEKSLRVKNKTFLYIQSYLEKDSLISAQYPLPDNTEDFLRLVKDFDARVVVFLCQLKDIESVNT